MSYVKFVIVNSLDELKAYETEQGYEGHGDRLYHDTRLDGDDDPVEYPVLVYTDARGRTREDILIYTRAIVTCSMAYNLLFEQANLPLTHAPHKTPGANVKGAR